MVRLEGSDPGSGPREVCQSRLVSQYRAAVERHVASDVTLPAEYGVGNRSLAADSAIGPDDRALDNRFFFDLCLAADHGIRSHTRAGLDEGALIDEDRPFDPGTIFNARIRRHTLSRLSEAGKGWCDETAIHDVLVDLRVFFRRSDIDPVAVVDVGHERLTTFDE